MYLRALNWANPRAITTLFVRTFLELKQAGKIDRTKTCEVLGMWQHMSALVESDTTWGASALIAEAMGISWTEIEGAESLALGRNGPARKRAAEQFMAHNIRASQAIKQTQAFKMLDDGKTAMCIMLTDEPGNVCRATNEACDVRFRSMVDMVDDYYKRRTASLLLSATLIAPEDRHRWFEENVTVGFSKNPKASTYFYKQFSKEGQIEVGVCAACVCV